MPDYTYVMYRPLVTRLLPATLARDLTVKAVALQGRFAWGRRLFAWMAAARPSPQNAKTVMGIRFSSPVGVGPHIDLTGEAVAMWRYLGAGFTIVGPVGGNSGRHTELVHSECRVVVGADDAARIDELRLTRRGPVFVAVADEDTELPEADGYVVPLGVRLQTDRPVLAQLPVSASPSDAKEALDAGCAGVLLTGVDGHYGPFLRAQALNLTRELREQYPDAVIIAGPGIMTPADAVEALAAGADLLALFEGLVYAGPGLPRRINTEVLSPPRLPSAPPVGVVPAPAVTGVLGVALLLVVHAISRLLSPVPSLEKLGPFVFHNRVNLAGGLVCLALLWAWLAWKPLRAGHSWAWWTLLFSGATAAAAFLAAHLATNSADTGATLVLLVATAAFFCSLALCRPGPIRALTVPGALAWLWSPAGRGRLLLAMTAVGLLTGGAMITVVGHSGVFVPQDIGYLGKVDDLSSEMLAFIAADRLAFGAALLSSGIALLAVVWCALRPGARDVAVLVGCAVMAALVPAIGIHPVIGYNDVVHLTPFVAIGVYCIGGVVLLWRPLTRTQGARFPDLWDEPNRPAAQGASEPVGFHR